MALFRQTVSVIVLTCVFALGAQAIAPEPGTRISSQAFVSYVSPVGAREMPSNIVRAVLSGAPLIDLHQDGALTRVVGGFFEFPHRLSNPGNTPGTYTVTPSLPNALPFEVLNLQLVLDLNGNGLVEQGEPRLPYAPYTFSLAAGGSVDFIIVGQIAPAQRTNPTESIEGRFALAASLLETAETAVNTDILTVLGANDPGASDLELFKSVSSPQALRGENVVYTLTGTNNYPAPLLAINVTIDGAIVPRIILRDALPANIQIVEILSAQGATPLFHRVGDPLHTYRSQAPSSLLDVDAVGCAFTAMAAGQSFTMSFRAKVGSAATGTIVNTAQVYSLRAGGALVIESNAARLTVPTVPPTLRYYRNDHFDTEVGAARLGSPLYIQVESGDCNTKSDTIETVTIVVTSALTGDRETFSGVETGYNTGIFRRLPNVATQNAAVFPVHPGDNIIQTIAKDQLTAEIAGCDGVTVQSRILIDPAGIVYDSRNGLPLAGATVTLIDVSGAGNGGNAGGPARILDEDTVTAVPAEQVTTPNGEFRYPLVAPSTYRLKVTPPAEYSFPSVIAAGLQPAGRRFNAPGSVGGNFVLNASTGALFLDVPLDTIVGKGFTLAKEASRKIAEIGDSVIYTLTLKNSSGADFLGTTIVDWLPTGFRYETGTTRCNNVAVADPLGASTPVLKFPIGTLVDGQTTVFTYRVRLTPGSEKTDGINTAQATALGPPVLVSNVARARVKVETGIFDPRGVIIGTVFVDANGNDLQDPGEPGVPGVRLVLEDGTYAITDGEGQYSIYGQRAVTHVVKLDPHTLPAGAKLSGKSTRFALDTNSRFVDLKKSELHKANFFVEPTELIYAAIAARRKQADAGVAELTTALTAQFTADGIRPTFTDVQAREAAGTVGAGPSVRPGYENILPPGTLTAANSSLPPRPLAPVAMVPLENLAAALADPAPGFIGLKDGDTLPSSCITIRIKGRQGAKLSLLVNGEPASDRQIGKVVERNQSGIQAMEFIALVLNPGNNTLELVESDQFGNVRARNAIRVVAPDQLAQFKLEFANATPIADGRTPVSVTVIASDRHGVPVGASLPITLETTLGRWDTTDINPREPGTQVQMENGRGTFRLLPPHEPGEAHIVVSSGALQAEKRLAFLPELRPMIAAGVIEGRVGLQRFHGSTLLPLSSGDAFEEELRNFSNVGGDGMSGARGAFYLKGKVKGDTLLTLAYDSDKRGDDVKLFRDIEPDAYYPVYGDSSTRGYDAQSTGALYVRIDHKRSFALLGDFNTRAANDVRQLGDYNRSLNGVRTQYESSVFKGGLWASNDSTKQFIRELPANGTSGPFNFEAGSGVLNSETVEILTRDRNQTSVILRTEKLARNADYEFEPFTGRLLLRRPVPSTDENFNPRSLRITYEVATNGDPFWVSGGDGQAKLGRYFEIGGSFAHDENPIDPYDLQSANATLRLATGTYLIAESARSETLKDGIGYGSRLDLRHKSDRTEARVFYGETDKKFINPSSQLNAGRSEGSAKVTRTLDAHTQLIGEAIYTADQAGLGEREGVRVDVARTLRNQVKLTVGARASEETTSAGTSARVGEAPPISVRSLRIRADTVVPRLPQATVFGEFEQDVVTPDQRLVAAGGNYQVSNKTKLYFREEFISSLGGNFELNSSQANNRTLIGVETEYLQGANFFNEYRVKDAIDGRQSEAATGLRNEWSVAQGLRLHTTLERVTPFDGISTTKSTAATLAADFVRPADWKATGRVEGRWSPTADHYLNTLGYARKINDAWSFLGRTLFNAQIAGSATSAVAAAPAASAPNLFQGRILSGLAWRQTTKDEWNALLRYEYKYEQGSVGLGATDLRRQVHMLASSVNYQPNARWIFAGHYAVKYVHEVYDAMPNGDYVAHLVAGRIMFQLTPRWDTGLNAAATFSGRIGNVQYALGPELGYTFVKNVRVGLGYNCVGFSDRDFDASATARGLFLSLRIKFDEALLKWARFDRSESHP